MVKATNAKIAYEDVEELYIAQCLLESVQQCGARLIGEEGKVGMDGRS